MQKITDFRAKRRGDKSDYKDKVDGITSNLKSGDIVLYHGTGLPGWAIRKFTGNERTHTSLYMGNGEFGEAIYYHLSPKKRGAIERNPADCSLSHCKKIEVYRPKTSEESKKRAIDFVKNHVGKINRYDCWNSFKYIANVLPFLKLKQTNRKEKFYCSNLAMEAYKRAGDFDLLENVDVDNTRWVLPLDIAKSEKLEKVGDYQLS